MSASALLRASRLSAGLSQVELAERTATSQPDVSAIESGKRVPTVDTLERLLKRTGHRLVAIPCSGPDAVDTAERIAAAVRAENRDEGLRAFLDYSDRLAQSGRAERVILSYAEPGPTGSIAWDAALAALSDYWLNRSNLPRPEWMSNPGRMLSMPAAPHLSEEDTRPEAGSIPKEFRRRNVLVTRQTLSARAGVPR
jgi:transcriptional regulator with XRE-family HTH domain